MREETHYILIINGVENEQGGKVVKLIGNMLEILDHVNSNHITYDKIVYAMKKREKNRGYFKHENIEIYERPLIRSKHIKDE